MSNLTLILGPMKSGKSFELISYFAPLKYTETPHALYQPSKNIRDMHISSRNGATLEAQKIGGLGEILKNNAHVVGIDEMHMFDGENTAPIEELLKRGTDVIISSLVTDYRGKMFSIIRELIELGPKEIRYKHAVCEKCKKPEAIYSQVYEKGQPLLESDQYALPDDGRYTYQAVCRNCFIRK